MFKLLILGGMLAVVVIVLAALKMSSDWDDQTDEELRRISEETKTTL